MTQSYPDGRRVVAGLALASIAASAPVILMGSFAIFVFPIALIIASIHAAFLAFPVYMVLRRWFELGYLNAGVAGFLIGLLPITLLVMPDHLNALSHEPWSFDLLWSRFGGPLIFGALGAIGGLIFRKVVGKPKTETDYAATFE